MLLQWHVKDPGHSAKNAGGRLHLNTHTSLTQRSQTGLTMPPSRHSVGTYRRNKLTCNSSGKTWSQSSQLAEPMWTDPGRKNGISVHELISLKNIFKNTGGEWIVEHSSKILMWGEATKRHGRNCLYASSKMPAWGCRGDQQSQHFLHPWARQATSLRWLVARQRLLLRHHPEDRGSAMDEEGKISMCVCALGLW